MANLFTAYVLLLKFLYVPWPLLFFRATVDGRVNPLDHVSHPKSIPSAKSRGVLQMRGIPERVHVTHGSRRGIVQFQEKCLLTGVRNSVRDRLDVPQKILAVGRADKFE